jgi:membrane associated rhomboid family serine protease
MKTRPLATILLIALSLLITFISPAFDTSVYGVNGNPLQWWGFMPAHPLRQYGLTLIISPFLHLNFAHLLINCILLVPVGLMIERKLNGIKLMIYFLGIHFFTLILLVVASTLMSLGQASFLGISHIVVGLYAYWGLVNRKFGLLIFTIGVLVAGYWQNQNPLTILAHGMGIVSGFILFGMGRFRRK